MNKRYTELDSLRGIAAITVLIHHYAKIFPIMYTDTFHGKFHAINLIKYSPLSIIWSGHEAVVLFFILSGFVLSLPFHAKKTMNYGGYLLKRICRIYLPYICSVVIAASLAYLLSSGSISGLSDWFNSVWEKPFQWDALLPHLSLIGSFDNGEFNPVYWSLVHEMRISLLFPLLAYAVIAFDWKWTLGGSLFLAGAATVVIKLFSLTSDYMDTLLYLYMFVAGALLAKHHGALTSGYKRLSDTAKLGLVGLGVLSYTYAWWVFYDFKLIHYSIVNDVFAAVGASVFVIASLASKRASAVLVKKPFRYLGGISYSLYLYHGIVLFTWVHLLYGHLPLWTIIAISVVSAFVLAVLFYYLVELPSIALGKRLVQLTAKFRSPVAAHPPLVHPTNSDRAGQQQ